MAALGGDVDHGAARAEIDRREQVAELAGLVADLDDVAAPELTALVLAPALDRIVVHHRAKVALAGGYLQGSSLLRGDDACVAVDRARRGHDQRGGTATGVGPPQGERSDGEHQEGTAHLQGSSAAMVAAERGLCVVVGVFLDRYRGRGGRAGWDGVG